MVWLILEGVLHSFWDRGSISTYWITDSARSVQAADRGSKGMCRLVLAVPVRQRTEVNQWLLARLTESFLVSTNCPFQLQSTGRRGSGPTWPHPQGAQAKLKPYRPAKSDRSAFLVGRKNYARISVSCFSWVKGQQAQKRKPTKVTEGAVDRRAGRLQAYHSLGKLIATPDSG